MAPVQGRPPLRRRAPSQLAATEGLRAVLRDPRRLHELPSAAPALRGQPPHSGRPVRRRLLLHRRPHRSSDPHDRRGPGITSHQTLLHVLRPRRRPRATTGEGRRHREVPRRVRRWLGRDPSAALRASTRDGCHSTSHRASAPQYRGGACRRGVGQPQRRREANLRPLHGDLRRDGRQHRPEPRPAPDPPRGHGGVGQHDHRVHLRQRRFARRSGTRHVGVLSHPRQPDPPEQPRLGGS